MRSFKETIYFHREKENNWNLVSKAEEMGFESADAFLYTGYELEMKLECRENGVSKILEINGKDVSDKNIFI